MKRLIYLCFMTLVYTSCGSSSDQTPVVSQSENPKEVAISETSGPKNYCCFKTAEDGQQFFPVPTAEVLLVTSQKSSVSLVGCENEDGRSNFKLRYTINKNEYMLTLMDYCSSPKRVQDEYVRKFESMKDISEVFEEMDGKSIYKGFYSHSKKQKAAYLFAVVDGRFSIGIQGFEKSQVDEMLQLFALIPVDKLAKF